jgi:hypothetical protein
MRWSAVRGPMPQSIRIVPLWPRSTEQFPADPLANMQSANDIRVLSALN